LIVRRDLPLGVIAAQLAHAARESSRTRWTLPEKHLHFKRCKRDPDEVVYVVVLSVDSGPELRELASKLERRRIPTYLIEEPDLDGQATAVGVGPVDTGRAWKAVRRVLGQLPLFGPSDRSTLKRAHFSKVNRWPSSASS